jgi:exosome complex RNA-binding protein Rrp42 (RNase PH superfamily)
MISSAEVSYITDGIKQGIRSDGRPCDGVRPLELELGVIPSANGSCRVLSKACDIVVAIKCDISRPSPEKPAEGIVNVEVELSSTVLPRIQDFLGRQAMLEADSYSEVIANHISSMCLSSLDKKQFCIESGKACWCVSIDVLVERIDGPLLDPISIGVRGALLDLELPAVAVSQRDERDGDEQRMSMMPQVDLLGSLWRPREGTLSAICITIGIFCLDTVIMVDLDRIEESIAKLKENSLLTIAVNDQGNCCGIHKFGSGSLEPLIVKDVINAGISVGSKISSMLTCLKHKN